MTESSNLKARVYCTCYFANLRADLPLSEGGKRQRQRAGNVKEARIPPPRFIWKFYYIHLRERERSVDACVKAAQGIGGGKHETYNVTDLALRHDLVAGSSNDNNIEVA